MDAATLKSRKDAVLKAAEARRQRLFERFAKAAQQESAALLRIRDRLVTKLGKGDPRTAALDRRLAGTRGLLDSIRGTQETGLAEKPSKTKKKRAAKSGQGVEKPEQGKE
jgi:hypothetical protein